MRLISIITIVVASLGCQRPTDVCSIVTKVSPQDQDATKPNLLVIGDSISIGWTPYAAQQLTGYNVYHTYCNAESTSNGIHYISTWLMVQEETWDTVIFDFGDWDMPGNAQYSSIPDYSNNLQVIASEIKTHVRKVLFLTEPMVSATFSPVVIGGNTFYLTNYTIQDYNAASTQVMNSLNIPVLDLYSASSWLYLLNEYDSSGLHFNSIGNNFFGVLIAATVESL